MVKVGTLVLRLILGGKNTFDKATRKINYTEINLAKLVKDLYSENSTTLKKEIKTQVSGSIYHVHG